jgi:hypothetical protein
VETVVFSEENAIGWVFPATNWTDAIGDVQKIKLMPLAQNPITVWILKGTSLKVDTDVKRARTLYSSSKCGIGMAPVAIHDATNNPASPGLINTGCASATDLRSKIGFTPGQLNVYYLDRIDGPTSNLFGFWCGANTISNANTILISATLSDSEALAHELGHAFSLEHPDTVPAMPSNNLMFSSAPFGSRNNITTGQCFRSNAGDLSAVNTNGVRTCETPPCPTRTCPPLTSNVPTCCPVEYNEQ